MGRSSICSECDKRESCTEICADVETMLPSPRKGRKHRQFQTDFHNWPSDVDKRPRLPSEAERFIAYERFRRLLTTRQRQVMRLVFVQGMTQKSAAAKIGITPRVLERCMAKARASVAGMRGNSEGT